MHRTMKPMPILRTKEMKTMNLEKGEKNAKQAEQKQHLSITFTAK